jgi:hypothetical protein
VGGEDPINEATKRGPFQLNQCSWASDFTSVSHLPVTFCLSKPLPLACVFSLTSLVYAFPFSTWSPVSAAPGEHGRPLCAEGSNPRSQPTTEQKYWGESPLYRAHRDFCPCHCSQKNTGQQPFPCLCIVVGRRKSSRDS